MVKSNRAGIYYVNTLIKSRGAAANDVKSGYSFVVNILETNASEMMKAIDYTHDPAFMIEAFKLENEGASKQVHREVNRLVHNYLCALSTYADLTRNLMADKYDNTPFHASYKAEVQRRFNSVGLCRFVRDMRNFMTHRGLPGSSMEIKATPDRDRTASGQGIPVSIEVGVHYSRDYFQVWDGWKAPAKRYLDELDEKINLKELFTPHVEIMKSFIQWFDEAFNQHHRTDYLELEEMAVEYARLQKEDSANEHLETNGS